MPPPSQPRVPASSVARRTPLPKPPRITTQLIPAWMSQATGTRPANDTFAVRQPSARRAPVAPAPRQTPSVWTMTLPLHLPLPHPLPSSPHSRVYRPRRPRLHPRFCGIIRSHRRQPLPRRQCRADGLPGYTPSIWRKASCAWRPPTCSTSRWPTASSGFSKRAPPRR
ncbi:hypothetical protein B0H14DRAFT_2850030 [Mycena olivaceomarginata]|nr:hypothetical protein B0H14DRAFT_2850030 [Mycena olivaceomarginata]